MSNSLRPHELQQNRLPLSFTISQSLLIVMSIESVMSSNHLILCRPLLHLPSIFPSIRVFSNESALHIRCQSTEASASVSILPINIQGWFLLGLTGLTSLQSKVKSLLQHHNSEASILWHSAFLMVQFSHPYMTTGKTIVLTIWKSTWWEKTYQGLNHINWGTLHYVKQEP